MFFFVDYIQILWAKVYKNRSNYILMTNYGGLSRLKRILISRPLSIPLVDYYDVNL